MKVPRQPPGQLSRIGPKLITVLGFKKPLQIQGRKIRTVGQGSTVTGKSEYAPCISFFSKE